MRVVLLGAGSLSLRTAKILIERGHEVVVIERDREKLEPLSDSLECGLLEGDGTRPAVLRDADPRGTDVLLCLTGNDQANLIASLVGRSLGYRRILTRIDDQEFEHIAIELGLQETVVPARTIGRYLADAVEGQDILELSGAVKGDARAFLFVARAEDERRVEELKLPEQARVVHLYRDGAFRLADADTRLRKGDEVVVMTHRKHLAELRERFGSRPGRR